MQDMIASLSEADMVTAQVTAWLLTVIPSVVTAALVLIGGWIIAAWAGRAARRLAARLQDENSALPAFLGKTARYALLIVVLVIVLGEFGVQTASILAVLGTAGLAIGLAMQGTLSNVAAGVMLLSLRPFRTGDYVEAGDISGTVMEVGLFACELKSADGIFRFVPNSQIWSSDIINYTRNPTRRLDIPVGIGYGDDVDKARKALLDLARKDERVLDGPAPMAMVTTLGDSAVTVNLRCWARTPDYWAALWDLTEQAKAAMDKAGIEIPFPQRTVHHINAA